MTHDLYSREPLLVRRSIPVFSEEDEYNRNYEQISDDHIKSAGDAESNPWIEEEIWVELEDSTAALIRKYAKPGDRILDVGIGLGRLLEQFPELDRYGMDISFAYLELTRKKGIDVCYARIEDMPYQADSFDLVVCTDVLEHVLDFNLAVERIFSALRPDGVLVLRVPCREDLSPYLDPNYPYRYVHLRNFDEHSLDLMLTRVFGCEILDCSFCLYLPSAHKLRYRLPGCDPILLRLSRLSRSLGSRIYQAINECLYHPTAINLVVRKAVSAANDAGA